MPGASSWWCRAARCSFGEGLPALDDDAGDGVDGEGEHEEHQAGGDVGARLLRAVELAGAPGDLRRERRAAVEDRPVPPGARVEAGQEDDDGEGLAERAAQAEHRRADDAGLAERQHRGADHLPVGGAEGQGALLVGGGHLLEDLAGDRRDDRQHHDREDEAGEGQRALGAEPGIPEERDPAEHRGQGLLDRREELAGDGQAPEAVDDRGDRGQQVDRGGGRPAQPGRRVLRDEQRHRDAERHRDDHRDDRGDRRRPEHVEDAEARLGAAGHPLPRRQEVDVVVEQGRHCLDDQEGADQGDDADDEDAGPLGEPPEEPVPEAAGRGAVAAQRATPVRTGQLVDRAAAGDRGCHGGSSLSWCRGRAGSRPAPSRSVGASAPVVSDQERASTAAATWVWTEVGSGA